MNKGTLLKVIIIVAILGALIVGLGMMKGNGKAKVAPVSGDGAA